MKKNTSENPLNFHVFKSVGNMATTNEAAKGTTTEPRFSINYKQKLQIVEYYVEDLGILNSEFSPAFPRDNYRRAWTKFVQFVRRYVAICLIYHWKTM